jgi:alginate O-acetyltransferase complex protein AlgI
MWTLFDLPTLSDTLGFVRVMFGGGAGETGFFDRQAAYYIMNYSVIFAICFIGASRLPRLVADELNKRIPALADYGGIVVIVGIFIACTAYLVNAGYNPFLYFAF